MLLVLGVVLAVIGQGLGGYVQARDEASAVTPSGQFKGIMDVTRRGRQFESYRGIRYAEPPVGNLMFQPPKLMVKYDGVVNATAEGPYCPQPTEPGTYVDEDCLTINVHTPVKSARSKPLPVIVYMHSGGFYAGSGRSDIAGPHYLLDRDVVLATINYRLGSLGFLSTGDELAPGNNGFKDQVAALRWVRDNIAGFGGDPHSVTITGCSAGASSVMLHMISPMSEGLFHRAISMSWSPVDKAPLRSDMNDLAVKQARLLNCPTDSSKAIIDCLKTKSWKELGDSLDSFAEFAYDPIGIWLPIIEKDFGQERFLTMQPLDAIKEGKIHAVPYIISQTKDEFFWKAYTILENSTLTNQMNEEWDRVAPIAFMLPTTNRNNAVRQLKQAYLHDKPLTNSTESADGLGKLYGDSVIGFSVHRLANLMSRHSGQPVWYAEFDYTGNHSHYENPVTKKPTGAAHHDDLIYIFSLRAVFPDIGRDGPDAEMVDRMTALWYNMARYGDPNPRGDQPELKGVHWPRMTPQKRTYLSLDKTFSLRENLKEDRFQVWEKLYPISY
ncbi:juvenile hormone esterase-like isoform X2 [Aricia agestis]|uniref:juvenile hormone esterase-like isoform X2 n=1 Tax=Aricia agestis TaxID=91739 RepID=UPI001C202E48|nr:juvenile hormone esterase-like isoform X2 [Aricia agestis]